MRIHRLSNFLLLISVCLAASCAAPSARFYPVGIYSVPAENLGLIRDAGFNAVAGQADRDYLNAAAHLKLKVLAAPNTSAGPQFDLGRARQAVTAFDQHPALWAWYLVDEPDLHGIPPGSVAAAHRFLKSAGARKPTALVLFDGSDAIDYANIADITMIDRYPIPWLPLANFPQHVQMTRLALGKRKPLVAVIQAFDWNAYPDLLREEKNLRPPTYAELRCMTYSALVRQATGIFYFGYDAGAWKMTQHQQVWNDLKRVVAEVNRNLPLFAAEPLWWPYVNDYDDPPRRFNAALTGSVSPALVRVRKGNPSVPPGEYIVAVNTTPLQQGYSVRLPYRVDSQIPVFAESRFALVKKNWLHDQFEPYAIHVYGPLPLPTPPHRKSINR